MRFRPCIDIHNGQVKQIVGGSLKDGILCDVVCENFISDRSSREYALLFKEYELKGGHVILLNKAGDEYFNSTKECAIEALRAYPGGLQVGGGITPDNAQEYLDAGASSVIVTSYVFRDGRIDEDRLNKLVNAVGSDKIVLDISCKKRGDDYYVVTDRWQKFTDEAINISLLKKLSSSCSEFLVHAADVEGQRAGVDGDLIEILSEWEDNPITYAGGVGTMEDIEIVRKRGRGIIDVTVGSALDIYGGSLPFESLATNL